MPRYMFKHVKTEEIEEIEMKMDDVPPVGAYVILACAGDDEDCSDITFIVVETEEEATHRRIWPKVAAPVKWNTRRSTI